MEAGVNDFGAEVISLLPRLLRLFGTSPRTVSKSSRVRVFSLVVTKRNAP